jgi:uncharacterized protein YodC (DUF2158 family)
MAHLFNIGDIVRLKSGGPKMTVSGYTQISDVVICQWFNSNGELQRSRFRESSLESGK